MPVVEAVVFGVGDEAQLHYAGGHFGVFVDCVVAVFTCLSACFDTTVLQDHTHMGIRNIRERLKAMVSGTVEIQSTLGVGTKVLITIPKEVQL